MVQLIRFLPRVHKNLALVASIVKVRQKTQTPATQKQTSIYKTLSHRWVEYCAKLSFPSLPLSLPCHQGNEGMREGLDTKCRPRNYVQTQS